MPDLTYKYFNQKTMKTVGIALFLILISMMSSNAQSDKVTDQVIEGGKVVVELIKALGGKRDSDKYPGCKGNHADLCVENASSVSIIVTLINRVSKEKREMVILPGTNECCLQLMVGVWTYDLCIRGAATSIRKGDIMVEGCQNMIMNIKY